MMNNVIFVLYLAICPAAINMLNCENSGFCALSTQDQSSYFCQCLPGFTGQRCEIDIDTYCVNRECRNGGMCMEGYGENVSCICLPAFTGEFCESQIDWCYHNTCQNGGSCIEQPISGILCDCTYSFTGRFCEMKQCATELCLNGGSCLPADGSCICPVGFTGERCESSEFCASEPCMNGGTCLPADGSCICPVGFTGERCESSDFCASEPCMNGGTCLPADGSCICPVGFTGERCESSDFCASEPCMNGGTCLPADGSCICPVGFTGERCESNDFCASEPCMNGGTCEEESCICPLGYEGSNCGMDVDNCFNTICENGGTCIEGEGISTACMCALEYGGPICSVQVFDKNAPCPDETDELWNLQYPETQPGRSVSHPCNSVLPTGGSMTGNMFQHHDSCFGEINSLQLYCSFWYYFSSMWCWWYMGSRCCVFMSQNRYYAIRKNGMYLIYSNMMCIILLWMLIKFNCPCIINIFSLYINLSDSKRRVKPPIYLFLSISPTVLHFQWSQKVNV